MQHSALIFWHMAQTTGPDYLYIALHECSGAPANLQCWGSLQHSDVKKIQMQIVFVLRNHKNYL